MSLGIPAEDYDIQNNFGETDNQVDIFSEIEEAYAGRQSLLDRIAPDDFVMAFFPCIHFCGISQINITLANYEYKFKTLDGCDEYILERVKKRERFFDLLLKMCFVCIRRGIRLVVENPYTTNTYLKGNFIKPPSVVDNDRTSRGDAFVKPTAYWFFNCEPMHASTLQQTPEENRKYFLLHSKSREAHPNGHFAKGSSKSGICSEERSMISPDYARNFICDFLLGRGGSQ